MGMLALSLLLHRSLFHSEHYQPLAAKPTPSLIHPLWQATDHSICLCPVCLQIKTTTFLFLPDKSHHLGLHTSMKQGAGIILKDQPVQTFNLHLKTSSGTPDGHFCPQTLGGMNGSQPVGRKMVLSLFQRRQLGFNEVIKLRQQEPTRRLAEEKA